MARTFAPHVVTPDSALGGKKIEKSLTFDENNQTTLICDLGSSGNATNRKKTTLSFWIKLLRPEQGRGVITAAASGTGASATGTRFHLNSDGTWKFATQVSNSTVWVLDSTIKYRDTNAWYHVVMQLDTTQSTASDRVKIYVNGTQDTTFAGSYPSQNYDDYWSFGNWRIGDYGGDYGYYYGSRFMIADIYLLDGQSLDPTYFAFTETQTGIWTPKDYTGTFGDHGFHLEFKDDSAATATTMGKDTSGNANNFTPSNFSASGDGKSIKSDTPTNNKTTIDGLLNWTYDANGSTLREGNLKLTGSQGWKNVSTHKIDGTGKLYYEFVTTTMAGWQLLGILVVTKGNLKNPTNQLTDSRIYGFASTQATYFGGSYTSTSNVPSWTSNDVMGIKYEKGILRLYKNGTLATATATGIDQTKEIYAYIANDNASTPVGYARFDKDSWTQSANAGVDYTWQLSEGRSRVNPTLIRPKKFFDTITYTGDGATVSPRTGLEFKPDMMWIKGRNYDYTNHGLIDAVKFSPNYPTNRTMLYPNLANAETDGGNYWAHFTATGEQPFFEGGFILNNNNSGNNNGNTFVAWAWKAGGNTTSSLPFMIDDVGYATAAAAGLDGGTKNPTGASVSTKAGFSIVTYVASNGTNDTIYHGLNQAPEVLIAKDRDNSRDWGFYYSVNGTNTNWQKLNDTATEGSNDSGETLGGVSGSYMYLHEDYFQPAHTSYANGGDDGADKMVAYMWHSVPGFSKIGVYDGNGSSDGAFIHCGFRPAWVLLKRTSGAGQAWLIMDNKRSPSNPVTKTISPQSNRAEDLDTGGIPTDFLSDGFKCRGSGGDFNDSSYKYFYMAFAEQPRGTPFGIDSNAR